MYLLAFETATEACSVALWANGEVRERHELAPRRHAQLALPWADELLAEAGVARSQLDAIAVGRGPGAFTGVRLAIAIAQGIAFALDRPVLPISTLAVLAQGATAPVSTQVLALIDARMGEVYAGRFTVGDDGLVRALTAEALLAPAQVTIDAATLAVGSGCAAGDAALADRLLDAGVRTQPAALPHAGDCARLAASAFAAGEAIAPERLEPAYLREQVALSLAEQRQLRAGRER